MYKTVFLASVAASASANVLPREKYEGLFVNWMKTHNISFKNGEEFVQRLAIFANNHDMIEAHNAGKHTFTMGHNEYSHLTLDEFHERMHLGGTRPPNLRKNGAFLHGEPTNKKALAASVDWTAAGAVTPVKNQGSCGSCWSFSATGALEGAYQIKYGNLLSFSEQELVSCDKVDHACNGGWMDDAFTWVKGNGGLCTEGDYPYTSGSTGATGTCTKDSCANVDGLAVSSFTDVTSGSVTALMSAVEQQPVSIAIQANQPAFQFYNGGVLTGNCGQRLDHGVLATGYGTDAATGVDYWTVKNSWGSSWGEDGYIRIERSSADLCGVLDAASYPNL